MELIGSIVNQGSLQGQINDANGYLTGVISNAGLLGGQVVAERGLKGDTGDTGATGNGIASVTFVSSSGLVDTYKITFTNGTETTFDVTNGEDGTDGEDGFSPSASVSKVGDTATISITDEGGTTTATVTDGTDGVDGTDGHSPVVTASKVGKVTTVYVDGTAIATINDGNDGVVADVTVNGTSVLDGTVAKVITHDVPSGGTTGQVLTKDSGTDYDVSWEDPSGGTITDVTVDGTSIVDDGVAELETVTQLRDGLMTATDKQKLDGIASGAEVNVQSDWNQSTNTADDYIKNKPTIPTVNNATLTIQKNGTTVNTFTANASSNVTANITVPTDTGDLTNGAGFITGVTSTSTPTASTIAEFDSSAHMNSADMSAQDVSDFVDDLTYTSEVADVVSNMVDYIVEQGTSGIWTYRKWNSGIAECWGITSYASATFSAAGNSFMRGFVDIMLPTNLFNIAPIVFVNPVFGNVGSARTGSISASKFNVAVLSTISNASEVELQLFAKGTWK